MPFYLVDAVPAEDGGITADVPAGVSWCGNTDGTSYLVRTVEPIDRPLLVDVEPADDPEWSTNEQVEVGDRRSYDGIVYRCIQAHRTQGNWRPPNVPALWTPARADGDPWVQPTMAEDAYGIGDIVWHDGALWSSQIDANTTTPGTDDRWWVQVGNVVVSASDLIAAGGPFGERDPLERWRLGGV